MVDAENGRDNLHHSSSSFSAAVSVEGVVVQWLSSQICNVCALLETSVIFGILIDMVAAITAGYRT